MHPAIQILLLLLSWVELSSSQYFQSAYGMDPQLYGFQNYDLYPSSNVGYESGFYSPSGYGGYGYSSPLQTRSADDPASEAAIKSAMAPLNNIVSSIPSQALPISPLITLLEQQRSATGEGNAKQKKSNCTTNCSAAKNAVPEAKAEKVNQQTLSQSTQQITQQSTQQGTIQGTQMCQCPCTQGWSYPNPYYMPQGYTSPHYPKSASYYTVAHRTRYPTRTLYRPYSYTRPTSYYDPNYHRVYYSSIRN